MSAGLLGIYAVYLIFVGIRGNAANLLTDFEADIKGFAPWAVAILILASLRKIQAIKGAIDPFIVLALVSFVLLNYETVAVQVDEITGINFEGKRA